MLHIYQQQTMHPDICLIYFLFVYLLDYLAKAVLLSFLEKCELFKFHDI